MNWVYILSEPGLWTVGFYDPDGKWHSDSDHNDREEAAKRAHSLNGMNAATEPIHPIVNSLGVVTEGLTKREYFAVMAMQGILAHPDLIGVNWVNTAAKEAVACADALLKQLES